MKTILIAFLMAVPVGAQPAVTPPQLGFVADANRSLRPLLGIAGNLLLGDAVSEAVVDVASSASFAMVKTSSALAVLDSRGLVVATLDVDEGRALFAFAADGRPASVWLRSARLLQIWTSDHFEALPVAADALGGEVVAVGQNRLIVKRTDGLWVVDIAADGTLASQAALPGIAGPVLLDDASGALLYADGMALVIRGQDGTERHVNVGIELSEIVPLSSGWVRVAERGSQRQYGVRLIAGREQVYQLPEGGICCGR